MIAHKVFICRTNGEQKKLARDVLKFISNNIRTINKMGIYVQVVDLGDKLSRDRKNMLKTNGIDALPAVVTPNRVYPGIDPILRLYRTNISKFNETREDVNEDEDLLNKYFTKNLAMADDDEDTDDKDKIDQKIKMRLSSMENKRKQYGYLGGKMPSGNSNVIYEEQKQGGAEENVNRPMRQDNIALNMGGHEDDGDDRLLNAKFDEELGGY